LLQNIPFQKKVKIFIFVIFINKSNCRILQILGVYWKTYLYNMFSKKIHVNLHLKEKEMHKNCHMHYVSNLHQFHAFFISKKLKIYISMQTLQNAITFDSLSNLWRRAMEMKAHKWCDSILKQAIFLGWGKKNDKVGFPM